MVRHILAIVLIFIATTVAWAILGSALLYRTYQSDSELRGRVQSTWGAPQEQLPPTATWSETVTKFVESTGQGRTAHRAVQTTTTATLPLERTRARVALDLTHRLKGLRWFSTYQVDFHGAYTFRNPSTRDRRVTFTLQFPATQAIYDDLVFTVDGKPVATEHSQGGTRGTVEVGAGRTALLEVGYRSQGLERWAYGLRPAEGAAADGTAAPDVAEVRDFELAMTTNFAAIDFPENTLSPTDRRRTPAGWALAWSYRSLISGFKIGMTMPERLQPGPLASRISYFAPVSLFFFFFLMFIITTLRGIDLHPMNYFFLAAAFFSFHLLLAYLVDHLSIHVSFVICSAVSIALVVSYLRLVVGLRFAAVEAGLAQLIYLVLFSYAFFFKGITGLVVTIGSILTLFVVMQMTGRIRWAEKFAAPPGAGRAPAR
jgi:inner membrane protein involved in colicin E2 resistance